jgi:hypothetical protein
VLAVLTVGLGLFSNLAIGASSTVFTTQTPLRTYSDGPYELGFKWSSSQAGEITKIRFYRALDEAEDGGEFYVHLGSIWDEQGNLLTTVPFAGASGRTGEGWETATLFQPLAIEANKTYVVSVNILNEYVATPGGLASSVINGPLYSIPGGNGVYSRTPGTFPTETYNNANYFVDVEVAYPDIQPDVGGTLFTSQTPETSYSDGPYELGVKWTSSQPGEITKMRFYRALDETEDGGEFFVHLGRIWDEAGNLLATVPFAGASGRTGEGWESVPLFQPLPIEAGKTYVASVNVLREYVATPAGLASPVTNGPLSSIADGSNGVYSVTPGRFPTESYNDTNYFVDVEVVPTEVQPPSTTGETVLTTQTPVASFPGGPYELGMKWKSSEPGEITKIRFYRSSDEAEDSESSFVHVGRIWDEQGALLAEVGFAGLRGATGRTGEGWESVPLLQPLAVEANKTYVVSVNIVNDYVATPGGLTQPVVNGALSSIADGKNGVYSPTPGAFPNRSYNNANYFVDVEVVYPDVQPATNATVLTTQVPATSYSGGPYELGMKWTSSQAGEITKMRFYRAFDEAEDGGRFSEVGGSVHVGRIWDENGNLLAKVFFAGASGRTGEGWETASLFRPLAIEADKTYVASVNILSDYVATPAGLADPITNGPLSSIADGNNGVYSLTPGTFPTESYNDANYFVDVEVELGNAPFTGTTTLFTTETPTEWYADGPYELGMKWTSSQPGEITKMRFYRAAGEAEDGGEFYVHLGRIWDENGNLLATVPFAGASGRTGEGWETVSLFQPLPIEANKTYVVSVNILSEYVGAVQGLASPVSNGPLSSIADGNNGVYSPIPGKFPTESWFSSNYFVDVEVSYGP